MKANSRKFLQCMFCGEAEPTTKEHIFGSSISKQFPPQPMAVFKGKERPFRDPRTMDNAQRKRFVRLAGDHALAVTSASMCTACNNKNGKEISIISQSIAKFFKGELPSIPKSHNARILRYFQRIGLLIDLETCAFDAKIMTEAASDHSEQHFGRPVASAAQRKSYIDGEFLENVSVHLCRCEESSGKDYPMKVGKRATWGATTTDASQPSAKAFLFAIDKAAAMITVGSPVVERTGQMKLLEMSESFLRIPKRPLLSWSKLENNVSSFTTNLDGSTTIE